MQVTTIYIQTLKSMGNRIPSYIPLTVQIANTQSNRSVGLSKTTYLSPLTGMLFYLPAIMPVNVTMRNTNLYLDVIFVDENNIVCDIKPAMPYQYEFISSDYPVRYFIEVPMNTCQENQIGIGSKVFFQ